MRPSDSFLISDLLAGYRTHRFSPTEVIDSALERANQAVAACLDYAPAASDC
jgi:hypothetical protein